jgi:hypothetical protein
MKFFELLTSYYKDGISALDEGVTEVVGEPLNGLLLGRT